MFLSRNKKNNVYPYKPQFYYIKVGFTGVKIYRRVFVMILSFTRHLLGVHAYVFYFLFFFKNGSRIEPCIVLTEVLNKHVKGNRRAFQHIHNLKSMKIKYNN